jgi:hypothetical protein
MTRTKVAPIVAEVFAFMEEKGVVLADLIEVGGEDLKSTNPKKLEKVRRVEKCWTLMAKLGVKYADLENSPSIPPTNPTRGRRGEGHFSEAIESIDVFAISPAHTEPNEINDLGELVPVGDPGSKS